MNPYPARIAELHSFLVSAYGQRDTQAAEVLLAAALPRSVTGMRRPWIIIETDYPSRDTQQAWFSFGLNDGTDDAALKVRSLAIPRVLRAQAGEQILNGWLQRRAADEIGLFVDAEWRRLPDSGFKAARMTAITHSYGALLSQCVRLRTVWPKGAYALRYDHSQEQAELERLARRVLDSDLRPALAPSEIAALERSTPASLLYWCELVQRAAPLQADWEALTGGVAAIARGIARLYGDVEYSSAGWDAAQRVLRDTIPEFTRWTLSEVAKGRSAGAKAFARYVQAGLPFDRAQLRELRRLAQAGILLARSGGEYRKYKDYKYHPWRYKAASGDWLALVDYAQRIFV